MGRHARTTSHLLPKLRHDTPWRGLGGNTPSTLEYTAVTSKTVFKSELFVELG